MLSMEWQKMVDDAVANMVTKEQCQKMIDDSVSKVIKHPIKLFGLNASRDYAQKIAKHLGIDLAIHQEKLFDDGECYIKSNSGPTGNVRGHNVFVISSLYSDDIETVSDKLMKLCLMVHSLKSASAHEVTAVIPHLAWARQDRKTESRAPITTKAVARMLESAGIDRALLIDVHNLSAEQNAFDAYTDNLESKNLHAQWCAENLLKYTGNILPKIRVLSPDSGGLSRCTRFRNALAKKIEKAAGKPPDNIEISLFDKVRVEGKVTGGRIIGDVEDAYVIIYDDMISTGGTMKKACDAVIKANGFLYAVVATHGLFVGNANDYFHDINTNIVVSDTVKPFRLDDENKKKLHIIDTTKMVADAILRIHSGSGSISELLR